MFQPPRLETERLILRAHELADLPDCVSLWADPKVIKYITNNPSTEQRTWVRMLSYLGHWTLMGFGYWAVVEKASGKFIGELGFADFKREIEPSIEGIPELGWVLATHAHGKGYATEALKAAIEWGDQHLPSKKTVCLVSVDNAASLRVASKCGYQELARIQKEDKPGILFVRGAL